MTKRKPFGLTLLLCASLLIASAGCSAGNAGSGAAGQPPVPASSASAPAAPSPSASHDHSSPAPGTTSASASPSPDSAKALPLPNHPPSVSTFPKASGAKTGKVTALRLADPQTGWAGGEGWIAHTTDGGKHWSNQLTPPYLVLQIFALNAKQAWATLDIGDKRGVKLIKTTDGGEHWQDAGTVPGYSFFHFVSDKEAFSGNARTTDGGKTWYALGKPARTVGDVYYHDAKNGWAVTTGNDSFTIRKTTDGGKSWAGVLTRKSIAQTTNAIIRSVGSQDAWVELIGESGMSQTSYSLFHTADGGKSWTPVLAHSGAGSGPAPGFTMEEKKTPRGQGASPGALYAVNPKVAFMGGQCMACDNGNTLGKTTDGGKTWIDLKPQYPGYGQQQLAAADADHVWWICTDNQEASNMYVTSDGGKHWTLVHTFDKPAG